MSFSTKSSQDTRGDRMSLQWNVKFKTIAIFRTHDGERNTRPKSRHARSSTLTWLHGYCRSCRCNLIEACARQASGPRKSSTTSAICFGSRQESVRGIRKDCTRRLLRRCAPLSRASACRLRRVVSPERMRAASQTLGTIKRLRSSRFVMTCVRHTRRRAACA